MTAPGDAYDGVEHALASGRPGTRGDCEVCELEQLGRPAPACERAGGVGSHDERQASLRVTGMYGTEGIDGVRRPAALDLQGARGHPLLAGDKQLAHAQAVLRTRIGPA